MNEACNKKINSIFKIVILKYMYKLGLFKNIKLITLISYLILYSPKKFFTKDGQQINKPELQVVFEQTCDQSSVAFQLL